MAGRRATFTNISADVAKSDALLEKALFVPRAAHHWSPQQVDIFNWFETGSPHLVVRARAGTGKTTTIIEGVNRAPECAILVCAFNKRIAEELNARITNPYAQAKTLHAVGYAAIRRQWYGIPVASGSTRGDWLTDQVCNPADTPKPIRRLITLLHTKARDMHPMGATPDVLTDLALRFDYAPDEEWRSWPLDRVVQVAAAAMAHAAHQAPTQAVGIDFADMISLPLVWNLLTPTYDLVVVDEAQDMTLSQLTISQRICSGRICVVGDDRQAIYGFRGADSGSLDRLKRELGAAELPLTTTYRCAQSIVRAAQRLVPDIEAGATNPEGTVDECNYETLMTAVQPGEFVLSRLNAPLVSLTLQLLRRKIRAKMAGRDIGTGIQDILKHLKCDPWTPIETMVDRLGVWESKTVTRLAAYGKADLIDRCRDQADMLRAFAEDAEQVVSVKDLFALVDYLFTDVPENGTVTCSSVHKAKGLEAERVYVLQESLYRRGVNDEEQNIEYVATTRAKHHLTKVRGVPSLQRMASALHRNLASNLSVL